LWHRGGKPGQWWFGQRAIGPVSGPGGPRRNPALQLLDLRGGERLAFGRHPLACLGCADAAQQLALVGLARDDGLFARVEDGGPRLLAMESQSTACLARAVALHAAVEQGPDVVVERDTLRGQSDPSRHQQENQGEGQGTLPREPGSAEGCHRCVLLLAGTGPAHRAIPYRLTDFLTERNSAAGEKRGRGRGRLSSERRLAILCY